MKSDHDLPRISVIVRTHNEAARLRLALVSLEQEPLYEVVVTNDGSSDDTPEVLRDAAERLPLQVVHHPEALGRSAASNAAAQAASGEILLFLDGDNLVGPGCVAAHQRAHARQPRLIGRGETLHLRATRFLLDPQTAAPQPGHEARLARLPAAEIEAMKVTVEQVRHHFDAIARRAEHGIYPGVGPRRLYELEVQALQEQADSSLLWMAASGSNLSVRRDIFLSTGGFDPEVDLCEQREMAARLCAVGQRMGFVSGARTYHLTHRSGWRNPLRDMRWEDTLLRRNPGPATRLLPVLWASLADRSPVPSEYRIETLAELEQAAASLDGDTIERLRVLALGDMHHHSSTMHV